MYMHIDKKIAVIVLVSSLISGVVGGILGGAIVAHFDQYRNVRGYGRMMGGSQRMMGGNYRIQGQVMNGLPSQTGQVPATTTIVK